MTPAQLRLLGRARREAQKKTGIDESGYRLILRNVAHCESGNDIRTPEQFERVMALLEDRGYLHPEGERHFRNKVDRVNDGALTDRQLHMIDTLITQTQYKLPGLCLRFSADRTDLVAEPQSDEAFKLIEMLKAAAGRVAPVRVPAQPTLFPDPVRAAFPVPDPVRAGHAPAPT